MTKTIMKKLIALFLVLTLSFTACSKSSISSAEQVDQERLVYAFFESFEKDPESALLWVHEDEREAFQETWAAIRSLDFANVKVDAYDSTTVDIRYSITENGEALEKNGSVTVSQDPETSLWWIVDVPKE